MSVRRRARAERRRGWSGWVSDAAGPAVHLHAEREPSGQAVAAILELRDAVLARLRRAELEAGRWEDDGGPSEPEGVHRTYSLLTGRQAGAIGSAERLMNSHEESEMEPRNPELSDPDRTRLQDPKAAVAAKATEVRRHVEAAVHGLGELEALLGRMPLSEMPPGVAAKVADLRVALAKQAHALGLHVLAPMVIETLFSRESWRPDS